MRQKKIILLFGPTASGKSKLALDIAKELKGEIINADSMQVYKEIKVLSARPNSKNIKHHLYGFVSVKENFSVGLWYKLASEKIKESRRKHIRAKTVSGFKGGTGKPSATAGISRDLTPTTRCAMCSRGLTIAAEKDRVKSYKRKEWIHRSGSGNTFN